MVHPRTGSRRVAYLAKGGEFKDTYHVAVVTQLLENKIRIAEQNVLHTPLPPGQQWTRELEMVVETVATP